jgi:hypothetical protein
MPTVRAGELASPRLGDDGVALRAGGRRPPLVHEDDLDACQLGLVRQAPQQVGAPPIAQRQVLATPAVPRRDALGVSYDDGAHLLLHQPGHHRSGCLVVGLADPAAVTGLGSFAGCPVATPSPAASPPLAGGPSRRLLTAALCVLEMQTFLRPDLASRDEEALLAGHHGIRVDDAEVDARHLRRVKVVSRHGDLGRHVEKEPSRLGDEGDRAERIGGVGDRPAQAHPQFGGTPGDAQADLGSLEAEATPAEAHRDQCPLAAGKAGPHPQLLALGCLEEGVRVVLQHVLCTRARQLSEACSRELPAEGRKAGHLGAAPLVKLAVAVNHPGPHVPRRPQQAVAAAALGRGGAQGDPGGAVDLLNGTHVRKDSKGYRQRSGHFRGPTKKSIQLLRLVLDRPSRMTDPRVIKGDAVGPWPPAGPRAVGPYLGPTGGAPPRSRS